MDSASDVWKSLGSNSGGRVEKSTRVELGAASWRGLRLLAVPEGIAAPSFTAPLAGSPLAALHELEAGEEAIEYGA